MIETVGIVGLGALGGMYSGIFRKCMEKECVMAFADEERIEKYRSEGVFVNGELLDISYVKFEDAKPVDLLIFTTKDYSLREAALAAAGACGPDTIVMSFLNGVISEEIIEETIKPKHILYSTVQAMDAGKSGNKISFDHSGNIAFGERDGSISQSILSVRSFLDRVGIPYVNPDDMMKQLYSKWMLNVGVNQTCAYLGTGYEGVQKDGRGKELFIASMEEARSCAIAEGINLTEEDVRKWIDIINALSPDGEPSMQQDARAGRKTEVSLFAGTVLDLAKKHGIDVPVNELYCKHFCEQ